MSPRTILVGSFRIHASALKRSNVSKLGDVNSTKNPVASDSIAEPLKNIASAMSNHQTTGSACYNSCTHYRPADHLRSTTNSL